MRQVPTYLIVGNGRMAKHIAQYFSLLNIPYLHWHRVLPAALLPELVAHATHILVLINDGAIESFIQTHLLAVDAKIIHFSGSLVTAMAFGAHPLMTFSAPLYSLEEYQKIPFIVDADAPAFNVLLPGLTNPHGRVQAALKAKYHALCVMSGNFSCILWQKMFGELEQTFNIPSALAHPYLLKQTQNIMADYQHALTGPLTRNDTTTINKNIKSLENDPFQKIYYAFVACYEEMKNENS